MKHIESSAIRVISSAPAPCLKLKRSLTVLFALAVLALLPRCAHQQSPAVESGVSPEPPSAEASAEPAPESREAPDTSTEPSSDARLSRAVRRELQGRDCVWENELDIEITNGVVTLSGEARSLGGKRCAEEATQMVHGVRGVVNLIEVVPREVAPEALIEDVRQALELDAAINAGAINVAATAAGQVTLRGEVASHQLRQLIERVVASTRGVTEVVNRLTLDEDEPRDDVQIAAEIEARLRTDRWLDSDAIEVSVSNGEVSLEGEVASAAERSRAFDLSWIDGVTGVDVSSVAVTPALRPPRQRAPDDRGELSDAAILEAVQDALRYDPRVRSFNINVTVGNGTVELDGMVDSVAARRSARRTAMNTVGVFHVRNDLVVRPEVEDVDDEVLEQRAQTLLELHPSLERHELEVQADDGMLYLYGQVDTEYERSEAVQAVEAIDGVREVESRLGVRDRAVASPRHPWELRREVEEQLQRDARIPLEAVEVEVDDGTVILHGEVLTWRAYTAALENAHEAGAEEVVSRLRLQRAPIEPLPAGPPAARDR